MATVAVLAVASKNMKHIITGLLLTLMCTVGWGAGNEQYGNSVMQLVAKTKPITNTGKLSEEGEGVLVRSFNDSS